MNTAQAWQATLDKSGKYAPPVGAPAAAAAGPSAKQKALDAVATKQYPASKVEALLTKNPKDLSFYEKKKLSAYKKALQAQKDDLSAVPKPAAAAGVAASKFNPDDYEVDVYSAEGKKGLVLIGMQNNGMAPATIQKLVTGELKPDPNKPEQQKALEEAQEFLISGVVKKAAPAKEKAYYTDPFSIESQAAFTAIGKQHHGMKADTLTKFATGEWKPDGNKPYQLEAFDKVQNYLKTGKITASSTQGASSATWGGSGGSVLKGLQKSPPPITDPDKPQSTFAETAQLTGAEVYAIQSYTGSGYSSINGALRGKNSAGQQTKDKITLIDAAIAKSAAKTDMVVVRGISANGLAAMQKATGTAALGPGAVIKDLGYVSTTRSAGTASNFSNGGGNGVGLKIEVPKGARILPVKNLSSYPSEDEFILPRGSSFEILKLDEINNVLHVRLLAA